MHSRKASGAHAALCSAVPRSSCAKAVPLANKAANMTTNVYLNIKIPFSGWAAGFSNGTRSLTLRVPRPSNSPTRACEFLLLTHPAVEDVYELYGIVYLGDE